MPDLLSSHIYYHGPAAFTPEQVRQQPDLFAHRAALYYTPTESIPAELISRGPLDVRLALPTPDYLEFQEIRSYASPRLRVDLLQKSTERIRWIPVRPAHIQIVRYERVVLRDDHFKMGAKALVDALKYSTTGRSDRRLLVYFGAIVDDDSRSTRIEYKQEIVSDPKLCGVSVRVSDLAC